MKHWETYSMEQYVLILRVSHIIDVQHSSQ